MIDFKGTKGPWVASKKDRSIGPVCKDDDQSYGMILPVAWVEFNGKPGHQEADANLISAAPELLEALQEMIEAYDDGVGKEDENGKPWEFEMWKRAKAAVSKALG